MYYLYVLTNCRASILPLRVILTTFFYHVKKILVDDLVLKLCNFESKNRGKLTLIFAPVDIPTTEWCNIAFHDIVPQMQRYTLRHPLTNAACAKV